MSRLGVDNTKGILREGWFSKVDDYAISGGWALKGKLLVVGDASGGLFGFEGKSGKKIWAHSSTHEHGLLAVSIHPNGNRIATSGQDGQVRVWNAKDGQLIHTIALGRGWVDNVAWAPDGRWLAASIFRSLHIFDEDGNAVWETTEHPSTVSAISWSSGNEIATACYGQVAFFKIPTGELHQKLEWKGSLVSMVLSPSGDIVACGSQDNSVHFWRRSSGDDSMMSGYPCKPSALAFDETGTLLATSGAESVTVWSFEGNGPEGTHPGVLELHVEPITSLAFARQGSRLASGARDGAVAIWSLKSNGEGGIVGAGLVGKGISKLIWRPDDRAIAALDTEGGISVFRVAQL